MHILCPKPSDSERLGVNDLLLEIFREIFMHYINIPDPQNWSRSTVRHSMKTFSNPIPLTQVCGYWRSISCSFARLWTSIFVLGPSPNILPLVELWLERADYFPLTLEFVEKSFGRSNKETTATSNDLINRVFWRWLFLWENINFEFANIPGDGGLGMHDIRPDVELDNPPELYSVRLIDREPWDPQLSAQLWSRVVYNPHVANLETRSMPVGPMHKGITEFVCHNPLLVDDLFGLLASWPNLEKVQVNIKDGEPGIHYTLPDVRLTLDKLRYISVRKNPGTHASILPILHRFTCPRLQYLEVCADEGIDQSFVGGLYGFISRSGSHLRTLKGVVLVGMPKESILRFFSLPQLQTVVELKIIWTVDYFFTLLTPSHDMAEAPLLLPNLESLDVHHLHDKGWELSEMLSSRIGSLKKVNISSTLRLGWAPLSDRLWSHPNLTLTTLADARPGVPEQVVSCSKLNNENPLELRPKPSRLFPKRAFWSDIWIERPTGIRLI